MLEEKLDLFNLLLIRQRVNIEIVKYRESIPPRQTSWLGNWWGGNSAKSDGDEGTSQKLGKTIVVNSILQYVTYAFL